MSELSKISETLYVPMGGRIYASENFPEVFYDKKALEMKSLIPEDILKDKLQTQYTFMSSASRCRNIDDSIKSFLLKNLDANIVELGCGLETTYYRVDNGTAQWFELDLKEVMDMREKILPPEDRMKYIKASILEDGWIKDLSEDLNGKPTLFIASGLFYYFKHDLVVDLIKKMKQFKNAYLIFDAVSASAVKRTHKYMKKMGRKDAIVEGQFYCNKPDEVAEATQTTIVEYKKMFKVIDRTGMSFATKVSMDISDMLNMVKVIQLKLS